MAKVAEPKATKLLFDNVFGDAAMEADPFHQGDPVGVMAGIIAAFSAAIGPQANIETDMGKMPLSFWPILVGLSGAGYKGAATKGALNIVEAAITGYRATYIKEGFDSGLGIITGLHERLGESGQQLPMLVVANELSNLAKQTRSDFRLNGTLTQLFDGDTLVYKTGKDDMRIVDPHVSWIGMIQPDMWLTTKGSAAAATGTWNRFCLLWVKQSKKLPRFPSREWKARRDKTIAGVAHKLRKAFAYASSVESVYIPESVSQRYEAYHRPEIDRLRDSCPSNQMERAETYLLRVAALYCIFDQRDTMTVEDFDSALELMRYSGQTSIYLASNPEFIPRTALAQKVVDYVIEYGPAQFTAMTTKIGRAYAANGGYYSAIVELDGEVVIYKTPRKPGQKGPIPEWVTLKDAPLPPGAVEIDPAKRLQEELVRKGVIPDDIPEDIAETPGFQEATAEPEFTAERVDRVDLDDEPEEAEVVNDPPKPPKPPQRPVRALPAPQPPAPPRRTAQARREPPRTTQTPPAQPKRGGTKVTPPPAPPRRPEPPKPATAPDADAFDPSKW